jgi:SAM (Sterile alpha motif) domain-containing protein
MHINPTLPWLGSLGLAHYAESFAANAIERALLPDLTNGESRMCRLMPSNTGFCHRVRLQIG